MLNNKKIKTLEDEIISLKQINEQLEADRDRAIFYLEEIYPAVNNIEINQGWHSGSGNSTYKVIIDVYAEDLIKIIKFITNKKLKEKKWSMINSEIQARIRKEVMDEFGVHD